MQAKQKQCDKEQKKRIKGCDQRQLREEGDGNQIVLRRMQSTGQLSGSDCCSTMETMEDNQRVLFDSYPVVDKSGAKW